jgi:hypothetical protein
MGRKKKTQPPTPHVNIPDCAEVVLAKEFAAARTTNGKVFSWPTKPTDGSRGGLGCDGDPSIPGQVDIPGRVLKLIDCRSFIIAMKEDCSWAFGSYSCGQCIGLRDTSDKLVEQQVKIWKNPGDISSGDGIACMSDGGRIFFGDRPDDKQMWEDREERDKRQNSAIARLRGAAANKQQFSAILEELGRNAPGLRCRLCQNNFYIKWNSIQHLLDHHCDKVSELEKGMAAASTDSGSTSNSDLAAPSAKKAGKKSQKSQPVALASELDVEISGYATRGGTAQPPAAHQLRGEIPAQIQDSGSTSTSDPAAPSAKKAAKKSQKSQPAALASEPDVGSQGARKALASKWSTPPPCTT